MEDYPLFDVAAAAQKKIDEGFTVHQKFTCTKCRSRQTIAEPNKFFQTGQCEECGAITNILVTGCNYVAMFIAVPETMQ
jgi:hypothetical protein